MHAACAACMIFLFFVGGFRAGVETPAYRAEMPRLRLVSFSGSRVSKARPWPPRCRGALADLPEDPLIAMNNATMIGARSLICDERATCPQMNFLK
jgi:hypothetical protein